MDDRQDLSSDNEKVRPLTNTELDAVAGGLPTLVGLDRRVLPLRKNGRTTHPDMSFVTMPGRADQP